MGIGLVKRQFLLSRSTHNTNISCTTNIHSLLIEQIDIDRIDPSADEPSHGDQHRQMERLFASNLLEMSSDSSRHGREGSTSRDGGDDERSPNLGVATETTETECEDRGEAGGFPAENHAQEANGGVSIGLGGGEHEDEGHAEVDGEDVAGLDDREGHETAGEETIECIQTLGCGEDVGWMKLVLSL
jgi:hypothetical protein